MNSNISQITLNRIMPYVWVSNNSSSDIIILGESRFLDFRLLYLLSNSIHIEEAEHGHAVYYNTTNSRPLLVSIAKAMDMGL